MDKQGYKIGDLSAAFQQLRDGGLDILPTAAPDDATVLEILQEVQRHFSPEEARIFERVMTRRQGAPSRIRAMLKAAWARVSKLWT